MKLSDFIDLLLAFSVILTATALTALLMFCIWIASGEYRFYKHHKEIPTSEDICCDGEEWTFKRHS